MKAISLWQPWATLMAIGAKTIETRPATAFWARRFRGPLVICATKTWNRDVLCRLRDAVNEPYEFPEWDRMAEVLVAAGYDTLGKLPLGAAVCIVSVTGTIPTEYFHGESPGKFKEDELAFGNFDAGRLALHTDPAKLIRLNPPIPVTGHQGLWDFDEQLLDGQATGNVSS
jgi:hypothetical protein